MKRGGDLNFDVVAPINGFYRVVGATFPAGHPVRQNNSKLGEGVRGFIAERKVVGYVRASRREDVKEDKYSVFDRTGRVIGEAPRIYEFGMVGAPVETKWRYYRPVFEKSAANPWSDRVDGLIIVQSSADDADNLFKTAEFQQQMDSIATEVSPYLGAIQVFMGEEKL